MNQLKRFSLGMGKNPVTQNLFDYGTAAALGAGGQQVANWLTPSVDSNPLLSGALAAPLIVSAGRFTRGALNPASDMALMNSLRLNRQLSNPVEQSALIGSLAGTLGGGVATTQNIVFGGDDIDPNLPASILAVAAPLTYSLISRHRRNGEEIKNAPKIKTKNLFDLPDFI